MTKDENKYYVDVEDDVLVIQRKRTLVSLVEIPTKNKKETMVENKKEKKIEKGKKNLFFNTHPFDIDYQPFNLNSLVNDIYQHDYLEVSITLYKDSPPRGKVTIEKVIVQYLVMFNKNVTNISNKPSMELLETLTKRRKEVVRKDSNI